MIVALEVYEEIKLYFVDATNVFQTNVISDPTKRNYISLLSFYKE